MTVKPMKPDPVGLRQLLMESGLCAPHVVEKVWETVLSEMLILYFPPHRAETDVELADQCELALKAYLDDLAEFSHPVLKNAWRETRRRHRTAGWPPLGMIRDACLAQTLAPMKAAAAVQRYDHKSVERWPFALQAYDALATAQGQWCLRHSCGLAYWERIAEGETQRDERGNRRQVDPPRPRQHPLDPREVREIADTVERNRERAAAGFIGPAAEALTAMWQKREVKEQSLASQFLEIAA